MAEPTRDWLEGFPAQLRGPLARTAGGLPANIGLMLILMECATPGEAEGVLLAAIDQFRHRDEAAAATRLAESLRLLRANPQAFDVVRSVIAGLDHARAASGGDELRTWAAAFDELAQKNPEAGVALYSLGNPDLLEAATAEIVASLDQRRLDSPATRCLDIGCGIGRIERALAPRVASIVGIDISPAMVETARRRLVGAANVEFRNVSGRDLDGFEERSFDLVLAVDAFPYIVQSGSLLAKTMLSECARVLSPGGVLLILNYSYRGDIALDRAEIEAFAARDGLDIARNGVADLSLWDGVAFELRKR